MQRLYKYFATFFLVTFAILSIIYCCNQNEYHLFIIKNNNHSIIMDETLVFFKKIPISELEISDVILLSTSNQTVARVMDIQESSLIITYDDFSNENIEVDKNQYSGKLMVHLNEIGKLYQDYLIKYKTQFIIFPFICICIYFMLSTWFHQILSNESGDFEYIDFLKKYYDLKLYSITKTILTKENCINENIVYDNSITNHFPTFIIKFGEIQNTIPIGVLTHK